MNPCGVGIGTDIEIAFKMRMMQIISLSLGIIALNRTVTKDLAETLHYFLRSCHCTKI